MSLLEVRGLVKRFGATLALDGAALALEPGEILGLVGANGSGKSTLIRAVAGLAQPDAGEIRWKGEAFRPRAPLEALRAGIAVAHQELSLVPTLSVWANLVLPLRALGRPLPAPGEARALLEALGSKAPLEAPAEGLPLGERQLLEVAKALLLRPELLILDEPTAALAQAQVERLFAQLRSLAARGVAVLFVSHRLGEVRALCRRILVLRAGRVVHEAGAGAPPEELLRHLAGGEGVLGPQGWGRAALGPPLLEAEGLWAPGLKGVSLTLRAGEVLGLGGLQGQGQQALLYALFGALPWAGGRAALGGRPFRPRSPEEAWRAGLALVSGDRARMAFLPRPVAENLLAASWGLFAQGGLLDLGRARAAAQGVAQELALVGGLEAPLAALSGGNQQKAFLGRALLRRPRLLLLDDPTVGVDPPTRQAFYARVRRLAQEGVGVLLHSSDEEELLAQAHRVLVLAEGRVAAELSGEALTREGLLAASLGAGPRGGG